VATIGVGPERARKKPRRSTPPFQGFEEGIVPIRPLPGRWPGLRQAAPLGLGGFILAFSTDICAFIKEIRSPKTYFSRRKLTPHAVAYSDHPLPKERAEFLFHWSSGTLSPRSGEKDQPASTQGTKTPRTHKSITPRQETWQPTGLFIVLGVLVSSRSGGTRKGGVSTPPKKAPCSTTMPRALSSSS
jgi:hypothetical protein